MAFLVFTLLGAALCADTQHGVNPVEKVTELLTKLQAEVEAEGKAEAAAYDKYACFCKEQVDNKQYAIEKFIEQENVLEGKIAAKSATQSIIDAEIVDNNNEKSRLNGVQVSKQETRDNQNAAYVIHDNLLTKAISSLSGAIDSLQASKKDMVNSKAGYTLLVKDAELIKGSLLLADSLKLSTGGAQLVQTLASLLQGGPEAGANNHAYSYHSNEIVQTLESLLKNFRNQKLEADNSEATARQTFEMAAGARASMIQAEVSAATEKGESRSALEEELNDHKTDKTETVNALAADRAFLADLTTKCETKATDYDSRSTTRSSELLALSNALEILKSGASGVYKSTKLGLVVKNKGVIKRAVMTDAPAQKEDGHWTWVPDQAAVQTEEKKDTAEDAADAEEDAEEDADDAPVSFLQVAKPGAAARKQLIAFLTSKSQALKSVALNTLLIKLRSTASPFQKVKQMIQDLVTRLEQEAQSEADQKGWCDTEMSSATSNRDDAQMKIEDLNAFLTEKNALVQKLTEEIATLAQEIADLEKALNEATELRNTEHDENAVTVADATQGETAVGQAIDFLEGFYGSLLQGPGQTAEGYENFEAEGAGADGKTVDDMAPDAGGVSGAYGGKTDASKSIIGLMKVIESDFTNAISATTDEENAAESEYQTLKTDTNRSLGTKRALKRTKEGNKQTANLDIVDKEADLQSETTNLDNALAELVKLKPVCVDTGMSWEERTARREQEVESLKEALKILQNTEFGF